MDEGVYHIDPGHEGWNLHEPVLYHGLPEDMEILLQMNQLQRMASCCMDCSLDQCHGGESATKLVDLVCISV